MRWFVEVSRIGEDAEAQRYCVDAKQWQAALQEARKLRGDAGPLSKFSIELMDDGYRAVDPKLKIRYVVNKAPAGAPLTGANGAVQEPAAGPAAPATTRNSSAPATERMSGPPASAPAKKSARSSIRVPDDSVPPAPPPPGSPGAPRMSAHPTQRSIQVPKAPAFQLVRQREEEPTEKTPITYREYAYAVAEGTDIRAAEALLWARFREVRLSLEGRPAGQFVQLAVFDHMFERRPQRPPLATLAWKDWRGNPVVQFPGSQAQPSAPPPGSLPPPPEAKPAAAAAPEPAAAPAPAAAPVSALPSQPAAPAPKPAAVVSAPPSQPAAPAPEPAAAAPVVSAQPFAPAPSAPTQPDNPALAGPAPSIVIQPPSEQKPPTRRHQAGEDLIGELFETMHDLHFLPDLVSGAEFVLGVIEKTLPCEAILVHVFDINTQHYVVVRASAPGAAKVIMHRTPDGDALFEPVMRRTRSLRIDDAASDARYDAERWKLAGVEVKSAICGPVQLHGRYLGAVELVNPQGGGAFYESESNALDYICEQFAEFLSNRPIVLDAELILAKP